MIERPKQMTAGMVMALLFIGGACGTSDEAQSSESETSAPPTSSAVTTTDSETQVDEADGATDRATDDAGAEPSSEQTPLSEQPVPVIDPTSQRLGSLLSDEPGPNGWLIPAGRWTTSVFEQPVTFTTPIDLVLRGAFDEMLVFADPSLPEGPQNYVVLMRSSFIHSGTGRQPVPLTAEEVTATIESFPHTRVEETGVLETAAGPMPWWNMVVENFQDGAPYACDLGERCGPISFTRSQAALHSLEGETTTFYRTEIGELRLASYAVGNQPGIAELRDLAGQILGSAEVADSAEPPAEVQFLGTLGNRGPGIPAGSYVALVGDGLLRFEVAVDVPSLRIQIAGLSTWWITGPSGALGFVQAEHFIDPDADQMMMVDPEPEFEYVDPETVDEVLAWDAGFADILETGAATVGGLEATWWMSDELRTDNVAPCESPGADSRCVTTFTVDQYAFRSESPGDETDGRLYYIDSADVIMLANNDPGHTLDEQFDEVAPLLDGLTITPLR